MDLETIRLPAAFPDHPDTPGDVADYHWEVRRFDALVGDALRLLDEQGLAETTIVVMTSDHGMPFPRCKSNLYDCGSRVPLAARWPERLEAGVGDRRLRQPDGPGANLPSRRRVHTDQPSYALAKEPASRWSPRAYRHRDPKRY